MILYGTKASPYVRRLRVLLQESICFKEVDLFTEQGRAEFKKISPILKVPALQLDDITMFDSRVIFNTLINKGYHSPLSLAEENQLTMIDAVTDSLVQRLMLQRANIDYSSNNIFFNWNEERIQCCLGELNKYNFNLDNYIGVSVFTTMDWAIFRNLYNFNKHDLLIDFYNKYKTDQRIISTDPRD